MGRGGAVTFRKSILRVVTSHFRRRPGFGDLFPRLVSLIDRHASPRGGLFPYSFLLFRPILSCFFLCLLCRMPSGSSCSLRFLLYHPVSFWIIRQFHSPFIISLSVHFCRIIAATQFSILKSPFLPPLRRGAGRGLPLPLRGEGLCPIECPPDIHRTNLGWGFLDPLPTQIRTFVCGKGGDFRVISA